MMPFLIVESNEKNLPVIAILSRRIPAAPLPYLRQLLKSGKITTASGALNEEDILGVGDAVFLPASRRLLKMMAQQNASFHDPEILYESREILIVNKVAGLAVHAASGHEEDNLTRRVAELVRQRKESFRIAPIHRLDLESSGPVLFGKGKKACAELGKLFMERQVEKSYLALVSGRFDGEGTIEGTLAAKGKKKETRSLFRSVSATAGATLLELHLITGRQHQIRRQMAELGHPLFGDRRYGGPCPPALKRLFLHCRRLAFTDPFSGAALTVESPLPPELGEFAAAMELTSPG